MSQLDELFRKKLGGSGSEPHFELDVRLIGSEESARSLRAVASRGTDLIALSRDIRRVA